MIFNLNDRYRDIVESIVIHNNKLNINDLF